jgi:hypothetical protein
MGGILTYLLAFCGVVTVVLVVLVIYGNVLDSREDVEIYLNQREEKMMAGDQPALVRRMNRLARVILVLAVIAGISLLVSAGIWTWIRFYQS